MRSQSPALHGLEPRSIGFGDGNLETSIPNGNTILLQAMQDKVGSIRVASLLRLEDIL